MTTPPRLQWTPELIEAFLIHAGWSRRALAREMGINHSTVDNWIRVGEVSPRGGTWRCLDYIAERIGFEA